MESGYLPKNTGSANQPSWNSRYLHASTNIRTTHHQQEAGRGQDEVNRSAPKHSRLRQPVSSECFLSHGPPLVVVPTYL